MINSFFHFWADDRLQPILESKISSCFMAWLIHLSWMAAKPELGMECEALWHLYVVQNTFPYLYSYQNTTKPFLPHLN